MGRSALFWKGRHQPLPPFFNGSLRGLGEQVPTALLFSCLPTFMMVRLGDPPSRLPEEDQERSHSVL